MKKIYIILVLFSIHFFSKAQSDTPFRFPAKFGKENYLPNQIIYKLKPNPNKPSLDAFPIAFGNIHPETSKRLGIQKNIQLYDPKSHPIFQPSRFVKPIGIRTKQLSLIFQMEISPEIDLEYAINLLRQDTNVEYAEPIYTNYQSFIIPNDPLAQPTASQYHLEKIKAYQAWDIQQGNVNTIIAVVDNGFNLSNSDLSTQAIAPAGLVRDVADGDNNVSCNCAVTGGTHGTAVALCSSARANNGSGTAGTGYNCRFLPIKAAPNTNVNAYTAAYLGVLVSASQTGVKVINMSWGRTGPPSQADLDILKTVVEDYDVVLVAAAGNNNNTDLFYPAGYDEVVLSVAATDNTDAKADFSTFNASVDIAAPGKNIILGITSGGDSGTSFAAPLVAGAAALIRVQYPSLNAEQTIARLKTTTDYIDDLPDNVNYKGKLGTGRLNMQRALSDPLKAITLSSINFSNNQRGFLFRGMSSNIICGFKNQLDALANLQITLTSESPFLEVLDNQSIVGAVGGNTSFETNNDFFVVKVADNTPINTIALVKFQYQDGSYIYTEEVRLLLNPGHIDINHAKFAVSDDGRLAIYDNSFSVLAGMTFAQNNLLREAGLLIAVSNSNDPLNARVSDAVRTTTGVIQQDFTNKAPFSQSLSTDGKFLQTHTIFDDIPNNPNRIFVQVEQNTYAWNEANLSNAIIVEYKIKNLSNVNFENLYAGLFADWNINIPTENRAGWDPIRKMGYIYDPKLNGFWGGIILLTDKDSASYYAFDNLNASNNPIRISDLNGFTKAEKLNVLTNRLMRTNAGVGGNGLDVAHLLSGNLRNLAVAESQSIAFAWVVGKNLIDLQNSADAIKARFVQLKTSPTPIVSNVQACLEGNITIKPTNGNNFNFYNTLPSNPNAVLLATGSQLTIDNIIANQSIFVTGVDSLFESAPVEIQISLIEHQTDFETSLPELNLSAIDELTLTNTSLNSEEVLWKISKQGLSQGFSFVNATNENSENPTLQFTETGLYQIRLITRSMEGCIDSLSKNLLVFRDITTGISEFLRKNVKIYPNPSKEKLWIEIPDLKGEISFELIDHLGRKVFQITQQNTPYLPTVLDVSSLSAGIYFLKIKERNGFYMVKLVVQP